MCLREWNFVIDGIFSLADRGGGFVAKKVRAFWTTELTNPIKAIAPRQ